MQYIPYDVYKDLLNLPYIQGESDCYSVVRTVLNRACGVLLPNYARPRDFYDPRLDLFAKIYSEDYWQHLPCVDVKDMQAGDVLSMTVHASTINHVGIYLGNQLFLHQLVDREPREEALTPAWLRRIQMVSRHKDVEHAVVQFNVIDLMPNYQKVAGYVE
ncbi:hypothetical protein [Acinetobacter phage vB_AbaS_TCUP2199]|nr:hypothetical protein [Acinetobacter phage vB_AbaS_TCUP2199]